MHVGIASGRHIRDHSLQRGRVEPVAVDAPSHAGQGVQRGGMGDRDGRAFGDAQPFPGGFGERRLAGRHQFAIGLIEHRLDLPPTGREQHLGTGGQTLGAAHMAIGPHDRDRLVLGMKPQAPGA